jgi:hypothetical protein
MDRTQVGETLVAEEETVAVRFRIALAMVSDKARLNEWAPPQSTMTYRDNESVCTTVDTCLYTNTFTWKLAPDAYGARTKIRGELRRTSKPMNWRRWLAMLGLRLAWVGRWLAGRGRLLAGLGRPQSEPDIRTYLTRLKVILEAPSRKDLTPDTLLTLLNVNTAQFGSYTTMLWQVPALGLTAQAFLLTIALGVGSTAAARITASALSVVIATASWRLMHTQRGRAINQAELARRVSSALSLKQFLGGDIRVSDAMPEETNAPNVWDVDHIIYHIWRTCMALFILADIVIIVSVALGLMWFK